MKTASILVVEDDKAVRNLITTTLETQGYFFHTASDGKTAVAETASYRPDVIILDLGLPDFDGTEYIAKVRTWTQNPIIVVSARSEDSDKIQALDLGADDYLTKPFSVDELLARIRVALRKMSYDQGKQDDAVFINGDLKIDYEAGCVYMADTEIHVTPIEYKLLCLLAHHVGKVLTHNYILKEIWNSTLESDTQSLRVFMASLRKKIEKNTAEPEYIQTQISVGYRMLKK